MKETIRDWLVTAIVAGGACFFMFATMAAFTERSEERQDRIAIIRQCYEAPGCTISASELAELVQQGGER